MEGGDAPERRVGADPAETEQAQSPERETRRASLPLALFGAALLLSGAGTALLSTTFSGSDASAKLVGGNLPVNIGAGDPRELSAHNSPTLVASPLDRRQLALSSRIDTPLFSCALHRSSDGGVSWRAIAIPAPPGKGQKCHAPDVAFAGDGTLYFSFVTLKGRGNVPNAVWLARMAPAARSLSRPRRVLARPAFQVRLASDPSARGRLYLSWLEGKALALLRFRRAGNPVRIIRTEDGGRRWSAPTTVSGAARRRVLAPAPAVGRGGVLYLLYLDLGDDRLDYEGRHKGRGGPPYQGAWKLVLASSRDRGRSFEESVVEERLVPSERLVVFIPPFPALAVDRRSGRLYAAFEDARSGDADVRLWRRAPGSRAWQGPVRVNDTRRRDLTSQYRPQLAVAPNGRLDVVYYDRRGDGPDRRPGRDNVENEVSLQSSFDGGASFTSRTRLSERPFSSRIGFGSERGLPDLGSRLGLLSTDSAALAVWTDTRAGTVRSGKQDLARALVAISGPEDVDERLADGLRYGGGALCLIGFALLASWFSAGRRGTREPASSSASG